MAGTQNPYPSQPRIFIGWIDDAVLTVGKRWTLQVGVDLDANYMSWGVGFSAYNLPPGLIISAAGLISGSPSKAGEWVVGVSASTTDGMGGIVFAPTTSFKITVYPPLARPVLAPIAAITARMYAVVSAAVRVTNGVPVTGYSATGLPPGVTCNESTGTIAGAATKTGTYNVAAQAANAAGTTTVRFTITVTPAAVVPVPAPQWGAIANRTARVGEAFFADHTIANAGSILPAPTTYSSAGLPPGLAMSGEDVAGTPTQAGAYAVALTARTSGGASVARFTITVLPATTGAIPALPAMSDRQARVGEWFSTQTDQDLIPPSFRFAGTTWGATNLPPGLRWEEFNVVGVPTQAGTFTVTVKATNSYGTNSKPLKITVLPAEVVPPPPPPEKLLPEIWAIGDQTAIVGEVVALAIVVTNGVPVKRYAAPGLPPGLSCNSATGDIAGRVVAQGRYLVTAQAVADSGTGQYEFMITVNADPNGRSWWEAKAAGRLRRAAWSGRCLEYRNNIWWLVNFNATTMAVTSEAPVTASDFTSAEFLASDWVTSNLPGTPDGEQRNNWRWARQSAQAGLYVTRAAWARRYLEMGAGGLWWAVWTGATGGVTTRRIAAAGDVVKADFRARDWRAAGGSGNPPPADDSVAVP